MSELATETGEASPGLAPVLSAEEARNQTMRKILLIACEAATAPSRVQDLSLNAVSLSEIMNRAGACAETRVMVAEICALLSGDPAYLKASRNAEEPIHPAMVAVVTNPAVRGYDVSVPYIVHYQTSAAYHCLFRPDGTRGPSFGDSDVRPAMALEVNHCIAHLTDEQLAVLRGDPSWRATLQPWLNGLDLSDPVNGFDE